jgi:hypothetical protein
MPDWRALIRDRLKDSGLRPMDEMDVVEELAQHIEDRYTQLRGEGLAEPDALARSLCEIDDEDLVPDLLDVLPRDMPRP